MASDRHSVSSLTSLPLSNRSLKQLLRDLTSVYSRNRTTISRTAYLAIFLALVYRVRNAVKEQKAAVAEAREARRQGRVASQSATDGTDPVAKPRKVELDREFFRNLGRLLKICIPSWR